MSTPLLTFNAKSVSPEKLEKTLIGRKTIVDEISKDLAKKIKIGATHQTLIIAPRGSGKTHMTKLIYSRLKVQKKLQNKFRFAYMIEDEAGIASFIHLLLQILAAIQRHQEPGSEHIRGEITRISQLSTKEQLPSLKQLLRDYLQGRVLIVLLENLDNILKSMDDHGAALRDFMHEHNCISLIATSQSLSTELKNSKYPFYQFFKSYHLDQLSFDESFTLIKALASIEEDPIIKAELENELENNPEVQDKIRAIFDLTYGNHRLLVHFYSFFKADLKSDLSVVFTKQMNDLKSYYEQFVNSLGAQQQRVIQILSLSRNPITGKEIAQRAFLSANIVSKKLSELHRLGYVDKHKSGKEVFYEIKEPLMRICFEINENPDGIAKLFIDFLKEIYTSERLEDEYLKYKVGGSNHDCPSSSSYLREARMMSEAMSENQLNSAEVFEKTFQRMRGEKNMTIEEFLELKGSYRTIINRGKQLYENNEYLNSIDLFNQAIQLLSFHPEGYFYIGNSYSKIKDFESAIESFKEVIEIIPEFPNPHNNIANAYSEIKDYKSAINSYNSAIEINPEASKAYYNLGNAHYNSKDFESAIESYKKAIEIRPEYYKAHDNLGSLYFNINDFKSAINSYKKAIEINPQFSGAHFNLGNAYSSIKDFKSSINSYEKAIVFDHEDCLNQLDWLTTFPLLYHKRIDKGQLLSFTNKLTETYGEEEKASISLKLMEVGVQYLIVEDKRAIFQLSKEERKVFQERILDRIEG